MMESKYIRADLFWNKIAGSSFFSAYDADALDMAIKALKQEPCEDCISRQAAIDANTRSVER